MSSKIICTPRADLAAGNTSLPGMGVLGAREQAKLLGLGSSAESKPPSLAGVEKFIRAKVAAEAAKSKDNSEKVAGDLTNGLHDDTAAKDTEFLAPLKEDDASE